MEPAPGSVTVTMSGATFPGGQGAVGWGRSRQGLAPPVLLGPPADADLAPLATPPRQNGGRGQRRDHRVGARKSVVCVELRVRQGSHLVATISR
jgi:hypothetical protein